MKILKKIGIGLALLIAASSALLIFGPQRHAAAATFSADDIKNATYSFQDGGNISATFSFSSDPIVFTDGNITTSPRNFTPLDNGTFCDPGTVASQNGVPGNIRYGINIASDADLTKATIPATIKVASPTGTQCDSGSAVLVAVSITNPDSSAATDFQWDGDTITSLDGQSDSVTLNAVENTNSLVYSQFSGSCGSGDVILLDSAGGKTGKLYAVSDLGGPKDLSGTAIAPYFSSSCHLLAGPVNVTIAGTQGVAATGPVGSGAVAPSCDSNTSIASLSWIVCPILDGMDSAAGAFYGFVEGQLCFNTGVSSTTNSTVCPGNNNLTQQVEQAWGVFRVIATSLLVVVMLIMVISQAIGGGIFDAYTVRKTLPKLVAAAIFIQLSWVMLKWAIDLSNDLGQGIANLMFAPFGGESNMSLAKMVGSSWKITTDTGSGVVTGAFQFFTVFAAAAGAIANIPGLLALAAFTLIAILTGFVVLVLRKLLIVFLVILAPLAFIFWVLPGTDTYWKLWRQNFTRILLMFPMIMGLLAAGRIFAYIASGAGNNTTGSIFNAHLAVVHLAGMPVPYVADLSNSAQGFADLAIIVFAFFGPYLLLPKTFQWGGSFMGAAAKAIQSSQAAQNASKATQEGFKGWGARNVTDKFAKKYNPDASLRSRTANSILGGRMIPTNYRKALMTQRGDKWSEEEDARADAILKREGEKAMSGYDTAVTTKDGTQLAKYRRNEAGDYLDENGHIAYKKGADSKTMLEASRNEAGDYLDENGHIAYKKGADGKLFKLERNANGDYLGTNGQVAYTRGKDNKIYDAATGKVATDGLAKAAGKEDSSLQGVAMAAKRVGKDDFKKADTIAVGKYEDADKRELQGVAAMKQLWVDRADDGRDDHTKKMAIRRLTATSSWPEIQSSLSRSGNKVIDTESWAKSITTSPEDYPRILRSRVDATPHIDNWAKRQLTEEQSKRQQAGLQPLTGQAAKDFVSQKRVLYSIKDQMSNEDFQTQSEGYWEEVARVANIRDSAGNLTNESKQVQEALRNRFAAIHGIGGTAPAQLLGHLVGGSVQAKVDRALGPGLNVKDFVESDRPLAGGVGNPQATIETNVKTILPEYTEEVKDLEVPEIRAQYKASLISTTVSPRSNKVDVSPSAKVLAEGLAYEVLPQKAREENIKILNELGATAAVSASTAKAYNLVIKKIHETYDKRAQDIISNTLADITDPAEAQREHDLIVNELEAQKAAFKEIPVPGEQKAA